MNGIIHLKLRAASGLVLCALPLVLSALSSPCHGAVVVRGYDTPAYIDFERTSFVVREDQTNLVIGIVRTGEFRQSASVDFRLVEGTASEGSDYKPTGGTIYFPAGQSFKTITLPIISDAEAEADETFTVELYNPGLNVVLMHTSATITIQDAPLLVTALPRLEILPGHDGTVSLTWPDDGAKCVLERTDCPAAGPWQPIEVEPSVYEGRKVVIQPVTSTFYSYRLRSP